MTLTFISISQDLHVIVTGATLMHCVAKLRDALGMEEGMNNQAALDAIAKELEATVTLS